MRTRIHFGLFAFTMLICLQPLSNQAQLVFKFTTTVSGVSTVGNGYFTLTTNSLVPTSNLGSLIGYRATGDSITYDGITYTNLDFTVFNNGFPFPGMGGDGFQVFIDKDPGSAYARLELRVQGSSTVINGASIGDLVTVLSSFDVLISNPLNTLALYNSPFPPSHQLSGAVTSFKQVTPIGFSTVGIRTNGFGFNVVGEPNSTVVIETCTNVSNPVWTPISTNALTGGSLPFADPTWTNSPGRLYRVKAQ